MRRVLWSLMGGCALFSIAVPWACAQEPSAAPGASLFGASVPGNVLEHYRGGEATQYGSAQDLGSVSGNGALGSPTGNNVIEAGALGNASGVAAAIQNSGNNVLIQNSTVVTVEMSN
ncbi:MAG: hypothetical protein M0037_15125 [Betaproteobacteria bacterium]|nr:hypothetical protein [Betaproteobacteria bacterium]